MHRFTWRRLLTCLLLIALPIQGVAAAGMLACDRAHHHEGVHHGAAGHSATLAVDDDQAVDAAATGPAVADCGTCAPCCSAATMSGAVASDGAVSAEAASPSTEPGYRSVELGVFERPPQHAFA